MKVIIGSGKVSTILRQKEDVVLSHKDIEIKDLTSVQSALDRFPEGTVVINTAAKINLEWCEENREECYNVNVDGALNVGKVCKQKRFHLVHLSSGCIFDGMETNKVYSETDTPSPSAWYTKCKAETDSRLLSLGYDKLTIVRPRQLVSSVPNPTNMLTKFITLGEGYFIDSPNSMTCIEDMKDMIDHLIKGKHYGVFNLANVGTTSPYKIALKIKEKINPNFGANKITYSAYLTRLKVKRVNTILDLSKLISTGYTPRTAEDALNWCLENYGK